MSRNVFYNLYSAKQKRIHVHSIEINSISRRGWPVSAPSSSFQPDVCARTPKRPDITRHHLSAPLYALVQNALIERRPYTQRSHVRARNISLLGPHAAAPSGAKRTAASARPPPSPPPSRPAGPQQLPAGPPQLPPQPEPPERQQAPAAWPRPSSERPTPRNSITHRSRSSKLLITTITHKLRKIK